MKTSDSFIFGGRMECVNPNVRMSSFFFFFFSSFFSSFKIGNLFGVKGPIPGGLRSHVVYKFTCAGCNACYVCKTTRHFSTRVREHLVVDKASHFSNIFRILNVVAHCVRQTAFIF